MPNHCLFVHRRLLPITSEDSDPLANEFLGKQLRSTFWRNTQLIAAAAIGIVIYATNDPKSVLNSFGLHWLDTSTQIGSTDDVEKERNVAVGRKSPRKDPIKSIDRARPTFLFRLSTVLMLSPMDS